jgi:hypothetical protein
VGDAERRELMAQSFLEVLRPLAEHPANFLAVL